MEERRYVLPRCEGCGRPLEACTPTPTPPTLPVLGLPQTRAHGLLLCFPPFRSTGTASARAVTPEDPLRVIVAGGGLAGLVTAAACRAKGMRVAVFEQASSYAPYGGPIQIQSNALRAIQRINPAIFDELVEAGTVTADRVAGLKIGYRKGNMLTGVYEKGDWLVRFDTLGPAMEAGLPPTVVVDRPVIQQIMLRHGVGPGTVRINSRIIDYEDLGEGRGVKVAS